MDYLARLRRIPGQHGTAEMRLAGLALTLGTWSEAIRHATSAAHFSDEPHAHAVLGAALLRAGDPEESSREFARFLAGTTDSLRALYNDPQFFFARRGLDLRRLDQPEETDSSSWDGRDPRLLTPENERLLEHYARVTIAAVRCASRPGAWDGARTEQGVLLIRYGEPAEETRVRPEIGDDGRLRYEELRYHYPEFTIVLDDRSLLGRFHLAGGGSADSLSFVEGVRLIKRIRERYDPHAGEPPLAVTSSSWVLPRGDTGLMVTALDVAAEGVELQWDGRSAPFARFAVATRWRSSLTGEVRQATERFDTDRSRGCPGHRGFSAAFMESLAAGTWEFSLEVEDRLGGTWARRDTTLEVHARERDPGLLLAGPIPCWAGDGLPTRAVTLEATDLLPASRPVYGSPDSLIMYFEIHGLMPARGGVHQGSLTYSVTRVDHRPWWRRVLGGRVGPEVSVEVEAQGPGRRIVSTVEVRLPRVVAGAYEFVLRCIDDVGGRTASGRSTFRACGEGPPRD
jgi:GWxTD domain-containing protein